MLFKQLLVVLPSYDVLASDYMHLEFLFIIGLILWGRAWITACFLPIKRDQSLSWRRLSIDLHPINVMRKFWQPNPKMQNPVQPTVGNAIIGSRHHVQKGIIIILSDKQVVKYT